MAAIGDISLTLDVLAQTVGDILVRASDRWRPPPAGAAGELLTHQGADNPPIWAAPPPSTGSRAFTQLAATSSPTGAQASQGWSWTPPVDTAVHAALPFIAPALNATYQASLVTIAGGTIASVLGRTAVSPPQPTGSKSIYLPFDPPLAAVAGTLHAILATRTDAGASTNPAIWRQSNAPVPIPATDYTSRVSVVSILPAVGQAYTRTGGLPWTVNLLYAL